LSGDLGKMKKKQVPDGSVPKRGVFPAVILGAITGVVMGYILGFISDKWFDRKLTKQKTKPAMNEKAISKR
jgi:membrane protein DedA with SNARE-associated domain